MRNESSRPPMRNPDLIPRTSYLLPVGQSLEANQGSAQEGIQAQRLAVSLLGPGFVSTKTQRFGQVKPGKKVLRSIGDCGLELRQRSLKVVVQKTLSAFIQPLQAERPTGRFPAARVAGKSA